jgi:ubiquinone/menaquinone biosynthesis C-methylase UbiE
VRKVIAADVDEAVLSNRASDQQLVIQNGVLALEQKSIDLVVADWVLEHISDPKKFVDQVSRVLKSGGWFCARTPHKFSYLVLAASLIPNSQHAKALARIQPDREEVDIFPTAYKMNTPSQIHNYFAGWDNRSFVFRADPAYYFGSRLMYSLQAVVQRLMPEAFSGNLFVFVQKP